jgi:8-oxo-dGTP pyrophosphatase MutT (NUDIX family)
MIQSTLCYIEYGGDYLMLHRVKKEHDANKDKWIGVGGKFEDKESPEDCMLREVREETGLVLKEYRYRGIVTFVSDEWETEYMHLFTAPAPEEACLRAMGTPLPATRETLNGCRNSKFCSSRSGRATGFFCSCWPKSIRFFR